MVISNADPEAGYASSFSTVITARGAMWLRAEHEGI
jgi:hypothetical protein